MHMEWKVLLGFGVIFVVVILVIIQRGSRENGRTDTLAKIAEEFQMSFTSVFVDKLAKYLQNDVELELFSIGKRREVRNLFTQEKEGVTLHLFDYSYVTGHGKNVSVHKQTVFLAITDDLALPNFSMHPVSGLDFLMGTFKTKDIFFASYPNFAKNFSLRGPNEQAIRQFFTPYVLDRFENSPSWSTQGNGQHLIIYFAGKRCMKKSSNYFLKTA